MNNIAKHLGMKEVNVRFEPGDTVKVHTKVVEGDSERIQIFDGVVIAAAEAVFRKPSQYAKFPTA